MTASHFLWPAPQALRATDLAGAAVTHDAIEARLKALYPAADAVLFSSARAGLTAVLQTLQISRPHLVWCPAFSSHCVLEAVAHAGTPTPQTDINPNAALLYHQWGHSHQAQWPAQVRLIEDAVDSLLLPGCNPCISGGDFALWSLPKVLCTQSGGVVFCRHAEDAQALRVIRAARPTSRLQAWLRWQGKSSAWAARYWSGAESLQGGLPSFMLRQIQRRLDAIEQLVDERQAMLRGLSADLLAGLERAGRLPSNLPMTLPRQWQAVWRPDGLCSAGLRSFNVGRTAPAGTWAKVAPLPVHADISAETIRTILRQLDLRSFCDEFHFV